MYRRTCLRSWACLARLGYGDERLREALDLVASRADAQGRWKLEQTFNDRCVVPIEAKGSPAAG